MIGALIGGEGRAFAEEPDDTTDNVAQSQSAGESSGEVAVNEVAVNDEDAVSPQQIGYELEAEYDDDSDDPMPTDLREDPADQVWSWEVQESDGKTRPEVERFQVTDTSRVDPEDRKSVRRWGGKPVGDGGAPWLATIYSASGEKVSGPDEMRNWAVNHACGGALIANDWVLTAAHCTINDEDGHLLVSDIRVRVGSEDLSRGDDGIDYQVDGIVRHKDYSRRTAQQPPNMYDNDLALLHIVGLRGAGIPNGPAQVRPVPMNSRPAEVSKLVVTTNWYRYNDPSEGRERALLLKFEMDVPSHPDCGRYGVADWKLNPDVFCGANQERTVCTGDSGTPVLLASGPPLLVGITSWGGDVCTLDNEVGVYTQVAPYLDWINAAKAQLLQVGVGNGQASFIDY